MIALSIFLAGAMVALAIYHRSIVMSAASDRLTTSDEAALSAAADQVDGLNSKLQSALAPAQPTS